MGVFWPPRPLGRVLDCARRHAQIAFQHQGTANRHSLLPSGGPARAVWGRVQLLLGRLQPLFAGCALSLFCSDLCRQWVRGPDRPPFRPVQGRSRADLLHADDGGHGADLGPDVFPHWHHRLSLLLRHPRKQLRRAVLRFYPRVDRTAGLRGHQELLRGPATRRVHPVGRLGGADGLLAGVDRGHELHADLHERHPPPPVVGARAADLSDGSATAEHD